MSLHTDGGGCLEESREEEGELIWPGCPSYMPPGLLNDQVIAIVDDSTIVLGLKA